MALLLLLKTLPWTFPFLSPLLSVGSKQITRYDFYLRRDFSEMPRRRICWPTVHLSFTIHKYRQEREVAAEFLTALAAGGDSV
jgi:hypothetical protein